MVRVEPVLSRETRKVQRGKSTRTDQHSQLIRGQRRLGELAMGPG